MKEFYRFCFKFHMEKDNISIDITNINRFESSIMNLMKRFLFFVA